MPKRDDASVSPRVRVHVSVCVSHIPLLFKLVFMMGSAKHTHTHLHARAPKYPLIAPPLAQHVSVSHLEAERYES